MEPHAAGATPTGWLTASGDHGGNPWTSNSATTPRRSQQQGECAGMGRRGGEISHSSAFSWHWQVRHQRRRAGGDTGIHDYPRAVLRPMRGRDHRAAPRGLRRAVRTRAAPYTSPSLTLVCLLQAGARPSAFHAPRAFKDPATKGPKPKSRQDKDCATGPSAYCTCSFLIAVGTHQTSHLGS